MRNLRRYFIDTTDNSVNTPRYCLASYDEKTNCIVNEHGIIIRLKLRDDCISYMYTSLYDHNRDFHINEFDCPGRSIRISNINSCKKYNFLRIQRIEQSHGIYYYYNLEGFSGDTYFTAQVLCYAEPTVKAWEANIYSFAVSKYTKK